MPKSLRHLALPFSGLAFAVLPFLAAVAHAQVVVSTFSSVVVGPDTNPTSTNQDAATQYFTFNTSTGILSTEADRPAFAAFRFRVADQGSPFPASAQVGSWNGSYQVSSTYLTAGSTIDSSLTWGGQFNVATGESNLTDVFRGIRVSDGSGNYYYGYVTYSTGSDLGGIGPSTMTITSAGLQMTLNSGLSTPSAIPEPSTSAVLFGAATLGFTLWRRRRV